MAFGLAPKSHLCHLAAFSPQIEAMMAIFSLFPLESAAHRQQWCRQ
jgi:hypothetical protein